MSLKQLDLAVIIGRFQPVHHGWLQLIQYALHHAKRVLVLCGSVEQPPSVFNPWTFIERQQMLTACYQGDELARLDVLPIPDSLYDDELWQQQLLATVNDYVQAQALAVNGRLKVTLLFSKQQQCEQYQQLGQQWAVQLVPNIAAINAQELISAIYTGAIPEQLPEPVAACVASFKQTPIFQQLHAEFQFIKEYRHSWQAAPYPPVFVTVDALVVHHKHIVLIRRKEFPGKNLLALPGGFIEQHETLLAACLRELREETGLSLTAGDAMSTVPHIFDAPERSARGRTITALFTFKLDDNSGRAKLLAGDDAVEACWLPLVDLPVEQFYEDHYYLIQLAKKILAENVSGH